MEKDKQILRRELKREVKNNREIVTNEIYYKSNFIKECECDELQDYFDDGEQAFAVGIGIDWNEDVVYIECGQLYDALNDYFSESNEEEKETARYKLFDRLLKKIERYIGYTIWV